MNFVIIKNRLFYIGVIRRLLLLEPSVVRVMINFYFLSTFYKWKSDVDLFLIYFSLFGVMKGETS
jgi:hypothetical protein